MHSIIVDATTDCEEWFVVMVRLLQPNGRVGLMLWELLHFLDEVSETLVTAVLGLYNCEGIHIKRCVAWVSDGANNMRKGSKLVQERGDGGAWVSMFAVHCFAHIVDLVVITDC